MTSDPSVSLHMDEKTARMERLARLEPKKQAVIDAAAAMVAACKRRGLAVDYVVEGGLVTGEQKEIVRISLLDNLDRALIELDQEAGG